MQIKLFLCSILMLSLAQGCTFSNSSASFNSISGTSEEDKEKYQLEVINYINASTMSTAFNRYAFVKGISEIATQNGVLNWEEDEATLIAIGRGLKNANISGNLYETYKSSLADANINRMQMIQTGYDMQ